MPVLDTDLLVGLIRERPEAIRKLTLLADRAAPLLTTAINVAEIRRGVDLAHDRDRALRDATRVLQHIPVISFDARDGEEYGAVAADLERRGLPIGHMDTLVAAIVRRRGETVVTRNTRHYSRIPGLLLESW